MPGRSERLSQATWCKGVGVKRSFDVVIEAGLVLLIVFTALAFASVELWAYTVMELAALVLVTLWFLKMILIEGELRVSWTPLNILVIFFIGLVLFQLVPLPEGVLKVISPSAGEIYAGTKSALAPAVAGGALEYGLNSTVSLYPYATRTELLKLLSYAGVFFLITGNFKTARQNERFLCAIVFIGFFIALFGLVQHFSWNGKMFWIRELTHGGSPFGPFVNKNNFAGFIVMIIPVALSMFMMKRDLAVKGLFGFMALVMTAALFLSLSRGGVVAVFGALGVMGLLLFLANYDGSYKRGILILVFFLASLLLYLLYMGIGPVAERMMTLADKETYLSEGRWAVWAATVSIFRDFPLFGTGLDTFEMVFPLYQSADLFGQGWQDAHNDYLQLLAEMGLAGVLVVLAFFGLIWKRALSVLFNRRALENNFLLIGVVSSVAGFMFSMMLTFNIRIPADALLFAVMLAMLVNLSKKGANQNQSRRS